MVADLMLKTMILSKTVLQARWAYLLLLGVALLIPLFNHRVLDHALEQTRIMAGLMPANYLLLKWLGQLAWGAPVAFFSLFLLSWFRPEFNSSTVLAFTAITYAIFVTLYACYSSLQFALWLEGFK